MAGSRDRMPDRQGRESPAPEAPEAIGARWAYLGVGCFTLVAGFASGGMLGVLIAKIAGAVQKCPSDPETGAPCNWLAYAFFGAIIGAISLSSIALWRLRSSERPPTS
jgi:hypothetical protein